MEFFLFHDVNDSAHHKNCMVDDLKHAFDHATISVYVCNFCNFVQVHRGNMIKYLKNEHTEVDAKFSLNIQILTIIPDMGQLSWAIMAKYNVIDVEKRFHCGYSKCGTTKKFPSYWELEVHLNSYHKDEIEKFVCKHCEQVVDVGKYSFSNVLEHFNLHHRSDSTIECGICGKLCSTHETMHIVSTHKNKPIEYRSINMCGEKTEHQMLIQCQLCRFRVTNIKNAMDHFEHLHNTRNMIVKLYEMWKKNSETGIVFENSQISHDC